jgi:hypothetical protein
VGLGFILLIGDSYLIYGLLRVGFGPIPKSLLQIKVGILNQFGKS